MRAAGRKLALVLYGPTRMGKTQYARSLSPRHNYWKNALNLNNYDEGAELHIFDDLRNFNRLDYKGWMGMDDFTATGKYRREQTIKGGKPVIFCCNRLPKVDDLDWWLRNTLRVYIDKKLF